MTGCNVAIGSFIKRLGHHFGERISCESTDVQVVLGDESGLAPGWAEAVVRPETTAEMVMIAKEAADLGIAMVPRGAGSGKAGGCIPQGGLVVDMQLMNRIVSIAPQDPCAVVQAGVITEDLDHEANQHGLMYGPDPASSSMSTLGGNIATNAGGPRALKYGVTRQHVWALQVVLAGGEVLHLGRGCIKGVAGFDLSSLFVGSEGTLGFITQATLQLLPLPDAVETAWANFSSSAVACSAASALLSMGFVPRTLEMLDSVALEHVRAVSSFRIAAGVGAVLLLETDGSHQQAEAEILRLAETAMLHGADEVVVAKNEKEREGMRRARRLVSSRLKERYPYKLSDDIAVPRSRMADMLDYCGQQAEQAGFFFSAYGHMGDGNLHVNLLCDESTHVQAQTVQTEMIKFAVSLGGTVSGEHGIGLAKRQHLLLEQSRPLLAAQQQIKSVFDPQGLMNPGKIFA